MTFSITSSRKRTRIAGLSMVAAALLCSPFAYAEQGSGCVPARSAPLLRRRCLSGQSGQDMKTCMREAGAALQEARLGHLDDRDARYTRNALERCKALPSDDAKDCRDRVLGQGTVSGSVKGGGLYREKVTTEVKVLPPPPAPPDEPQPMAPAPVK